MPPFVLPPVNVDVDTSRGTHDQTIARLQMHRAALERSGLPAVSELGTLELQGNIVVIPGVVHAPVTSVDGGGLVARPFPIPRTFPFPRPPFSIPRAGSVLVPPGPAVAGERLAVSLPTNNEHELGGSFVEATLPAGAVFIDLAALSLLPDTSSSTSTLN